MSTTIDSLQIEIQSNSTNAADGIKQLAKSLGELKQNGTISVAVKNLGALSKALKDMTSVSSNANKISALAKAMGELKTVGSVGAGIKKLSESLQSLKGVDYATLDKAAAAAPLFEKLASSLSALSNVKSGGFGTMVNSLAKIGNVTKKLDDATIDRFADRVAKLSEKLTPLSDKMTTIQAGLRGVNSQAKAAGTGVKELGDKINATTLNLSSMINVIKAAYSALQPVIRLLENTISQAIEWDGIAARFGRGFGSSAEETYEWIQSLNKEMGINVQQFMQYSSVYATMLTGFGVATKDATKMALGYTELTYDIWAGYNDIYKNFADAAEAVKSAIAGEVEPIRRAGFTIVEATLEQTAANHGLEISLEKATEAQKSYLRYLTLVDQAHSQNLVGTYAKELNTAEGLMRTFAQQLKSLAQTFGSLFLPILVKVMPWMQAFVELLTEAIRVAAAFFGIELQEVNWDTGGIDSVGDAADSATGSIEDTTDALKDLQKATVGIDELNVISPPSSSDDSGSGSGGDSGWGGIDVDSLWDESIFDSIQSQVDEIKAKIEEWLPSIKVIGAALAGLGIAVLLSNLDDALAKMGTLNKLIGSVALVTIEAALVFKFADDYLEEGNFTSLIGEAIATAVGSYLLYKAWGATGLTIGIGVSVAAQLLAIGLNLADGGVEMDDPELWLQTAFTTALGGVGGGLIAWKGFGKVAAVPGGATFGALAALSLSLAAITIGNAGDGDLGISEGVTGVLATALGGVAGAQLCTYLGLTSARNGFLIGAAAMLAITLIGAAVASNDKLRAQIEDNLAAALATAFGAGAGGWLAYKGIITTSVGKGIGLGALLGLSLGLAYATIDNVYADGKLTGESIFTALFSVVAAAGFGFMVGGPAGAAIGAAIGLVVNLVGATVAAAERLKDDIKKDIGNILTDSGEYTIEDVTVEVTAKFAGITAGFDKFKEYAATIDGARQSIRNVITSINDMRGAIGKGASAFDEYVPKILADLETLQNESKKKLEAIRTTLIEALAGGLGEGYDNLGGFIDAINNTIDGTLTRMDELEVILSDTAKIGTEEWEKAWDEYKTLVGESISVTEALSKEIGKIDWSGIVADDGTLDSGALKSYFSDITNAANTAKEGINTYYSELDNALQEAKRLAQLRGDFDAVLKFESLIDTNRSNWDKALGEVNTIAQETFNQLQQDVILRAQKVVTQAQEEYKNLSWWKKLMYPTEASYVQDALSEFKSGYVDPISDEMSAVFEALGIDGSTWAGETMTKINDALFKYEAYTDGRPVVHYKDSIAGAIIGALEAAGQDATPFALSVADSVGLDLSNGLDDQYSLIYDSTTGALSGVYDGANKKTIEMTPDLKAAMDALGIDVSDRLEGQYGLLYDGAQSAVGGVFSGANGKIRENAPGLKESMRDLGIDLSKGLGDGIESDKPTLWEKITNWCNGVLDWFRNLFDTHSPSKKTKAIGKDLSDGLALGMESNSIKGKLQTMWDNAKTWWDKSKGTLSTYVPSIGDIKSKLSSAWSTAKTWWENSKSNLTGYTPSIGSIQSKLTSAWNAAKTWWNNSKGSLSTYTPSIGNIKDKLSSAWDTAKKWWDNNVKLSIPSLSLKVTYTEATGWKKAIVDALGLDGWPKLSFAANGGIFDTGSLVWAGEAGPEIVANAGGGRTGVMNVEQMQNAVYEGVYAAVVAAMRAGGSSGGNQAVNVYLDGRQITATVEQRQRERGASIMGNQVYSY